MPLRPLALQVEDLYHLPAKRQRFATVVPTLPRFPGAPEHEDPCDAVLFYLVAPARPVGAPFPSRLATQYIIGAGQIGIVYYGISRMMQANDSRTQLQRELMERQERQSERRHAETMAALKDQGRALSDQGQALQALIQGMQAAIERTGGRGPA